MIECMLDYLCVWLILYKKNLLFSERSFLSFVFCVTVRICISEKQTFDCIDRCWWVWKRSDCVIVYTEGCVTFFDVCFEKGIKITTWRFSSIFLFLQFVWIRRTLLETWIAFEFSISRRSHSVSTWFWLGVLTKWPFGTDLTHRCQHFIYIFSYL